MNCPTDVMLANHYAKKLYDQYTQKFCEKYHLSAVERDIMLFLGNNHEYDTATEIVEMRRIVKSQVSTAVDSLVKKGYLRREKDEVERRRIHLIIQENAMILVKEAQQMQHEFISMLYEGFTEAELQKFKDLMDKMYQNLEKNYNKIYKC